MIFISSKTIFSHSATFQVYSGTVRHRLAGNVQGIQLGHRMELYVNPEVADPLIQIAASFQVDARIVGKVVESNTKKLTIESEFGTFIYP